MHPPGGGQGVVAVQLVAVDLGVHRLQPFQFQAVLDGATYNVIVTWNIARQGWYLSVVDQSGNLIGSRALVGSPPTYPISLVAGYFVSTLVYYPNVQQFVVSP